MKYLVDCYTSDQQYDVEPPAWLIIPDVDNAEEAVLYAIREIKKKSPAYCYLSRVEAMEEEGDTVNAYRCGDSWHLVLTEKIETDLGTYKI